MNGRKPTKAEQDWLDQISELPCIVCHLEKLGATPAEIHHIDGSRKPECHFITIPLCYKHHRSGVSAKEFVSRHPYKKRFEARYGTENELLEKTKQLIKEKEKCHFMPELF